LLNPRKLTPSVRRAIITTLSDKINEEIRTLESEMDELE
jgi:flagellar basal body-associated protein FliL